MQIISKTTSNWIFFIEYGHEGYQKNPLSTQISKKSSTYSDKMHLEKVTGKIVMKNLK
jgi:hypothetical protein